MSEMRKSEMRLDCVEGVNSMCVGSTCTADN
jgi:hypothetical protein